MLKQKCNGGCHGPCRCEHAYKLCVTACALNHVSVPEPLEKGCPIVLESSRLVIKCKCCPVIVVDILNPLVITKCDGTYLDLDMNDLEEFFLDVVDVNEMKYLGCSLKYALYVNTQPYMAGLFNIDYQFC